ncbi:MAG TPA: deoxyribodipyrimidine photolyase [Desulfuromonadales bacterium]|nr:deoxyribodipyrimidine photolyase [Desulfuromonadales bacterium]
MKNSAVPVNRCRCLNDCKVNPDGDFVLYRMLAYRRLGWNFALQRAAEWAAELDKPLVVYEELALEGPWASQRSHGFVLDGMRDHLQRAGDLPVCYYPFLEPEPGAAGALLETLCELACLLIEDDAPVLNSKGCPAETAAQRNIAVEAVDSNGLLPLAAGEKVYPTAYSFRRFLHKELPGHLLEPPAAEPLDQLPVPEACPLPGQIRETFPPLTLEQLEDRQALLQNLALGRPRPVADRPGGNEAANEQWQLFFDDRLEQYPDLRNEPQHRGTSGLSAYLRHGQISVHQIFHELAESQNWSLQKLGPKPTGKRSGWWGMSGAAEAFLDELVTWRELGYNMAWHEPDDYQSYTALPDWAKTTLADHADDPRPVLYTFEEFERGATADPLWNAAQHQLLEEGRIHGYLRMLWGKKILEWSPSPREAAETMIELNNRYALDGCDPNSYSGIYWCLGRYDRAWGPERPIFGKVRYMSSENTARKYQVRDYIRTYDGGGS